MECWQKGSQMCLSEALGFANPALYSQFSLWKSVGVYPCHHWMRIWPLIPAYHDPEMKSSSHTPNQVFSTCSLEGRLASRSRVSPVAPWLGLYLNQQYQGKGAASRRPCPGECQVEQRLSTGKVSELSVTRKPKLHVCTQLPQAAALQRLELRGLSARCFLFF